MKHQISGRSIEPSLANSCRFQGFHISTATQWLTRDGFIFKYIPLKDGGKITSFESSFHYMLRPRAKKPTPDNITARRYAYSISCEDVAGTKRDVCVIFTDRSVAKAFFARIENEEITFNEIVKLSIESSISYPVVGKMG